MKKLLFLLTLCLIQFSCNCKSGNPPDNLPKVESLHFFDDGNVDDSILLLKRATIIVDIEIDACDFPYNAMPDDTISDADAIELAIHALKSITITSTELSIFRRILCLSPGIYIMERDVDFTGNIIIRGYPNAYFWYRKPNYITNNPIIKLSNEYIKTNHLLINIPTYQLCEGNIVYTGQHSCRYRQKCIHYS
jgi:hypothetical protein